MSNSTTPFAPYVPPKVWSPATQTGGAFASINRPVAGQTHELELPVGKHPLQLYSLGTPNGQKVTIMLEELLAAGHTGAEYDAWLIRINEGAQFGSGFVDINPNSKIPALVDRSGDTPVRVFESGSILVYLAEKFGAFLPKDLVARTETFNWLMWQMGSAPFVGGGFGHFYAYAPEKLEYPINRYAMEAKRPARRARPPPGRAPLPRRRRIHHRRHGDLAVVRRPGAGRTVRGRRIPGRAPVPAGKALGR
jgi:GST-like protein